MVVSSIGTFVVYVLSILLLRSYFDTSYITWQFGLKVVAITVISWLPLHLTKWIMKKLDPSEDDRIRKQEARSRSAKTTNTTT